MDNQEKKYRLSDSLIIFVSVVIVILLITSSGCESSAQTGTALGAGIGALAGQAIGGDTEATLIGAAVGMEKLSTHAMNRAAQRPLPKSDEETRRKTCFFIRVLVT